MSLDDLSPTSLSGGTTQDDFNQTSGVSQQMPQPQPLPDLTPDIAELAADFKRILPMMGPAAMRAFHRQIGGFIDELQGMQNDIQHALLPYNLAQTREWLGLLPHALGEQFMQSADRANIAISVNPKKSGEGAYASYNHEYGFVNGVEFNTTATNAGADNDSVFFGTYIHEILHGASTRVAPALYFTPWNKATNVVMHPLAWMRVENISERMSYAASALGYYFLSLAKPEMKDHLLNLTEKYVVSLADVIEISKRTSSLQELVTETTLTALDKRLIRGTHSAGQKQTATMTTRLSATGTASFRALEKAKSLFI